MPRIDSTTSTAHIVSNTGGFCCPFMISILAGSNFRRATSVARTR
jgi:hypothetical protein